MITVTNLSVSYGAVHALREVSLHAATGEITAVLGSNGAGKTTLLRTISGLKRPSTGEITLDDRRLTGERTEDIARLGVAHVPEGRAIIGEFTVEENLRLGALMAKVDLSESLAEQYEQFPVLGDRRRQHAAKLSGGERQMLVMARALIARPSTLLLDEPSLGLAPQVTSQLMHGIRNLCSQKGLTVILVEQNASSALRISDHAVILHLGRVVAQGDVASIAGDDRLRSYYLGMVD